jgi:outer membrane protein OmpA-like peptidoglycan-associated protein
MKRVCTILCIVCIGMWIYTGVYAEEAEKEDILNHCPEITDMSLSDSVVRGGEQVEITVTTKDPDNDKLIYFWIASRGTLSGQETQVIWTLPGCSEVDTTTGTHDLAVEVSDGECTVKRLIKVLVDCTSARPIQVLAAQPPAPQIPDSTILFPQGSAKLDNIAKARLDTIAALLKQFPNQSIFVEGHTDATGNEKINKQVGLKRAESAKRYLVTRHGIDPNRISITSYGSIRPVDTNASETGRAKNRRVEIYQRF